MSDTDMRPWQPIDTAPDGVVLDTKIDDGHGERNVQPLKLVGRLWFLADGSMYVYYRPTHWRERIDAALSPPAQEPAP